MTSSSEADPSPPVAPLSLEEAARQPIPPLHPLAGSTLRNFWRHLRANGDFSRRSRRQRALAGFALLQRWPLALFEATRWRRAVDTHELTEPPVFLIGHWGSGTTYLHNLLSQDPAFGFLDFGHAAMPGNFFGTSRYCRWYLRPFVSGNRRFDSVKLDLEGPQEEELALANLNALSFLNGFYFPKNLDHHTRRALLFDGVTESERAAFEEAYVELARKLSLRRNGRRLLFKNPASTTRIPMLRRLFPGAKFVHLVRNPYAIFAASLNRTAHLFSAVAWQDFDRVDLETFTLDTYDSVMRRYLETRDSLPPGDLHETTYERLIADPAGETEQIYDRLELGGNEEALSAIRHFAETQRGYPRRRRIISAAQAETIARRWNYSFACWDYPLEAEPVVAVRG